jgi:hypothetical protein
MAPGSSSDTFTINGCGYGGSTFNGTGAFTNNDYILSFNGTQNNCGGCGNKVVIAGYQQQ